MLTADHFIPKEKHAFALDAAALPALTIAAPAVVTFQTDDVGYRRLASGESIEAIGVGNLNMVTGPVAFEGAAPGDAVRIEVLEVSVSSAWSAWLPRFGPFGKQTERLEVREIPLQGGWAVINESLYVPVEPMIGCIGLAPAQGASSTVSPAFPWGGNMDLRELSPGAVLYLPVQTPGGLLFIGDLHAAMGAGEPAWVSLESAGQATVRISLEKGLALPFPRLRVGRDTLCLGMGKTLEEAMRAACDHAFRLLVDERGLSPSDAYVFASAQVGVRFGGPGGANVLAVVPDFCDTSAPRQ